MSDANAQYRDSVFRSFFNEPTRLLSLCKEIMRLSDTFGGDSSSLELTVTVYNINRGVNSPLTRNCPYLRDYSILVGEVKDGFAKRLSLRDAIIRAVKFCLDNGIMSNYLVEHSEEVFNMLALEWNLDDAKQAWFEDGMEQGRAKERESVAIKMLRKGKSFEEVSEFTDLNVQQLEELAKSNLDA